MNLAIAGSLRPMASLLLLLPVVLASCRVSAHSVTTSEQSQKHDRLEIIYQSHPTAGQLVSSTVPPTSDVIQVAAQVTDPSSIQNLCWSKAELRIVCPHPDGRSDWARVSLHFRPVDCGQECAMVSWSKQAEERMGVRQSRRATYRERWFYESPAPVKLGETFPEIDLPKAELDSILAELNSHGFFTEQGRPSDAESQLEVRVNRRWTSKRWGYEPTLDALTTRVYEEGIVKTVALNPRNTASASSSTQAGASSWFMPFGHSQ